MSGTTDRTKLTNAYFDAKLKTVGTQRNWKTVLTLAEMMGVFVTPRVVSLPVRIVLDTASFVTAIRSSDGAAGALLRMIFSKRVVPLMDLKLGLEYRDVSLRAEHLRASRLSGAEVLELIEAVEAFAEPVEVIVKTRPLSSDPDDDLVLDVALNGRADAVVTNNTRHFAAAGRRFGIEVLTPGAMLEKMRREAHDVD